MAEVEYTYHTISQSLVWGSPHSRELAFPFGNYPQYKATRNLNPQRIAKGHKIHDLNRRQGYIKSTVTINGIPAAGRRVLCFTQAGIIIDESMTDKSGNYRFDNLDLTTKYMIIAQDSPAFGDAEYNAVAADFQSPTEY